MDELLMNKLCPFPWYGGKFMHLNWLLEFIDNTQHDIYIEPFGGSAAVLLNKKPSKSEIYNDIYHKVVNFFKILRDDKDNLINLLSLTPYSREEFCNALTDNNDTPLEQARKFFVVARQVTLGLATTASPGRWCYTKQSRRGMSLVVSRWLSAIDGLESVAMRLRQVQIECLDWHNILQRYDDPSILWYIDPPYPMSIRTGGPGYKNEFTENDHKKLLNTMLKLQGKVIVSSYNNNAYNTVLKDWNMYLEKPKSVPSTRRVAESIKQEIIWTNY